MSFLLDPGENLNPALTQTIDPTCKTTVFPRQMAYFVCEYRTKLGRIERTQQRKTNHQVITQPAKHAKLRALNDRGVVFVRDQHVMDLWTIECLAHFTNQIKSRRCLLARHAGAVRFR